MENFFEKVKKNIKQAEFKQSWENFIDEVKKAFDTFFFHYKCKVTILFFVKGGGQLTSIAK